MSERGDQLPNEAELLSALEAPILVLGTTSGAQYFGESNYMLGRLEPEAAEGLGATVWLDNSASSFALRSEIELPDDVLQDGSEAAFQQLIGQLTGNGGTYIQRDGRVLFNGANRAAQLDNVITFAHATDAGSGKIHIYTKRNNALGLVSGVSSADRLKYGEVSVSEATRSLGRTTADVLNALYAMRGIESDIGITLSVDIPQDVERPEPVQVAESRPAPGSALVRVERQPQEGYLKLLEGYPSFSDFGGLDAEIAELVKAAKKLNAPAELLDDYGLGHIGGVLLQGPGGVGKTSLMKAWAKHMRAEFREVRVSDILSRYVGDSTKNLRDHYKKANAAGHRVVLCFNEFDGLFSKQASGNEGVAESLIAEFKTILENRDEYPNVVTAATTNSLDNFDPALLRPGRFGLTLAIGLPNEKARTEIFSVYIYKRPQHFMVYDADDLEGMVRAEASTDGAPEGLINIPDLVARTQDWTGDDIKFVVESELWANLLEELDTGERPAKITHARLVRAINYHRQHRPSGADAH